MLIDHLFVSHHNLTLDNSEFKVSLASQKIILVSSAKIRKSTFLRRVNYVIHIYISPQTYTQIHTRNVVQWKGGGGGGVDGTPPRSFLYVAVFRNDFTRGKHLIYLIFLLMTSYLVTIATVQ